MAQPARRIPAWKRLGLKLKNSQSEVETPENEHQVAEHQHGESHAGRGGDSNVDTNAAGRVEESNPGLGKRKHPAEDDGPIFKKSKKTQDHHDSHGNTGEIAPSITGLDNGATAATSSAADATDKSRPKGDPNYRKKKGRKSDQYDARKTASTVPAETRPFASRQRPRTPSLSPGQQDLAADGATLLVSTETDFPASSVAVHKNTRALATNRNTNSPSNSLSPRIDRRKSVTFTPDTKTVDGNSASNLFKKWAQEQKGAGADFSQSEVAQFAPPPKSHPANDIPAPRTPLDAKADKAARKAAEKVKKSATAPQSGTDDAKEIPPIETYQKTVQASEQATTPAVSAGKKKDISRYTDYLEQYYNDKPNWKFNKAKQNDILENALNIFRIPDTHSEALVAYVKGLQGAGVIERLKQRCAVAVEELDAEISTMDDTEVRKATEEEALQERLSRERKRRRLEGDIENMLDHPYSEGYIRRLKRGRAQALLTALNLAAPAPAPVKPQPRLNGISKKFSPEPTKPLLPQSQARKRKRRTDISSDDSSDSSSSDSSDSDSSDSDSSSSGDSDQSDSDSVSDSDSASSTSSKSGASASGASSSAAAPESSSEDSSSSDSASESGRDSEDAGSDSDSGSS